MKKLLLVILVVALAHTTSAAVIEVPLDESTIQSALDVSSAGDTILVSPGTYGEQLVYPSHRVTVLSSDGPDVTFLTSPAVDQGGTAYPSQYADTFSVSVDAANMILVLSADSGSSFEGFTVTGTSYYQCLFFASVAGYFEITNNRFIDNYSYDAIRGDDNASLIISDNLISNSISGNAVVTTGPGCFFINNTVDGGPRGLAIYGPNSTILNNIVVNIDWYAIWNPSPTTVVDYNDFWNNDVNGDPGSNGISADPLFVDAPNGDYYLLFGSPCIDAGHPDPDYNDPDGSRADIGAFPASSSVVVRDVNLGNEDLTHVISHTPTVAWTFLAAGGSPQEAYELEVGIDDDWTSAEMWATGAVTSSETFAVYAGDALEDGQTYYVRVRASDGIDWSDWETLTFTLNSVPAPPTPDYPISQQEVRFTNVSLIVLNSDDVEGDILHYHFEVYGDAGLTDLVAGQIGVEEQDVTTSTDLLSGLEEDREYWWRARCDDGHEFSDWSATESFLTTFTTSTILVPANYPTIQGAIDAAVEGDMVLVSPGVYIEAINFGGKDITVVSTNGPEVTVIQASATSSSMDILEDVDSSTVLSTDGPPTVSFMSGESEYAVLDGFSIHNPMGYGIYCSESSPVIQNCEISECYSLIDGAGIWCLNSGAIIRNNIIHDNYSNVTSAGVGGKGDVTPEIAYNEFYNNIAANGSGIGFILPTSNINIHHNLLRNNSSPAGRLGAIYVNGTNSRIINNTVVGNSTSGISILGGSGIDIFNNIVVSNTEGGIIAGSGVVDYNDVWDNGTNTFPGPNGISADPLFLDPLNNDYGLQIGSPCINAGHPDPIYNDPDGTRNDMGAFFRIYGLSVTLVRVVSDDVNHVTDHTPTIAWEYYDPDGLPQFAFEVEVGTDGDWSVAESWATGEVVSSEASIVYAGESLDDGATYYIRARVNNGSQWSDWSFGIFRMNSIASAPVPVYPVSQETVRFDGVRLRVVNSIDLEEDDLTYDFEVYADAGLTDLVAGESGVAEQVDQTASGVIAGLEPNNEYWWKARAYDGFEYSEWSNSESFVTADNEGIIRVPEEVATIQDALDVSFAGDTILVSPGTYYEVLTYPSHAVTLMSTDGPEHTFLNSFATDGPAPVQGLGSWESGDSSGYLTDAAWAMVYVPAADSGSSFEGFTVMGESGLTYIFLAGTASWFEISNNRFIDNETFDAIRGSSAATLLITNNLFSHTTTTGNVVVTEGPNCTFVNNTADACYRGLAVYGENSTVLNNIVVNMQVYAIANPPPGTDYNDFWNNGTTQDPGPNGISADPLFVDVVVDDYSLQDISPCVDAGHPDASYNDPDGSRNDMGAYPLINELSVTDLNFGSEDLTNVVNHTPTIGWTFHDPDGGSQVAYEIEVGTDADWSVAEMWATGEVASSESSTVYAGQALEDGQSYYLRIKVSNGIDWSDWRLYWFNMNSLPTIPAPVYPVSQEVVRYNGVSLRVDNASDPEGDVLTYDFEVYSDAGLTELFASEYGVEQQEDQTSSAVITGLEPEQQYWWQARCYDSFEHSDWSETESFVTEDVGAIVVPDDYPTIQAAIEAATVGDVILVAPGVYNESINFLGKAITVLSMGGSAVTTIQTAGTDSPPEITDVSDSSSVTTTDALPAVSFTSGETAEAVLDGFTVHNPYGRGIYCYGSSPIIQNCEISQCYYGGDGAGIWCINSGAKFLNNKIHHNTGGKTSAGIGGQGSVAPEIAHNIIYNNTAANGSGIGFIYPTANVNIHHNVMMSNSSPPERQGAIYVNGANSSIINNTVVANHTSGISILDGVGINILNNIVVSNSESGIIAGSASVDYNDVWNNVGENQPGPNGISADPLFLDEADQDYNLTAGSPCIDAGHPDAIYNDPDGSRNDMGAIPFGEAVMHPMDIHLVSEELTNVVGHTPTIAWTFYDPQGASQAAFEVEVGTDADWSVAEMWATGVVTSSETYVVYSGNTLEDGQTCFMRIRVSDGVDWSDWEILVFHMNSLPTVPTPVYPVGGVQVRTASVYLQVANAADAEGDELTYDFEVYADAAMTEQVAVEYGVEEMPDRTISGLVEGLEPDHQYWWKTRAFDSREYSTWSSAESFITKDGGLTFRVPQDYGLIQQAIDVSMSGDVILVDPGVYTESINFLGKDITVISSEGRDVTVIQASATDTQVEFEEIVDSSTVMASDGLPTVSIISGESEAAVLDGFTIHNPAGRGIYIHESSPVIQNCDISECYNYGDGAGIWCHYAAATIRNNIVHHNVGGNTCAGIGGQGEVATEVCYNVIYENQSPHGAGIGFIAPVSNVNIHHNIVSNNTVNSDGQAALYMNGTNSLIINNTVVSNVKGMSILNGGGVKIYNNIAAFNGIDGLVPGAAQYDYNDVWANGTNNDPGVNGISADPLFVDLEARDYHLMETSPCIDAGHPDAIYNDPNGSRNDIGALWYHAASIDGVVSADGAGLFGVAVDLYDQASTHLASAVTDESGAYSFTDIDNGTYLVSMTSPLGFYTEQELKVVELSGTSAVADFELTATGIEASQRTRGFWAHQIVVAMSEVDGTQVYRDELCEGMDEIRKHFNDNRANPITAYEVIPETTCDDRLEQLNAVIAPQVGEGFTDAAIAQFTALLLNVATDKLWQREEISEDGAVVSQAITQCDQLLVDGDPGNDTLAQAIAETINKGQLVEAGIIDPLIPMVMYKELDIDGLPMEFSLSQNYPNPFNPNTQINFALPEAAPVRLDIFNIMGQKVARLVDRTMEAGYHTISFDGSDMASGIYLYRLQAGDYVEAKKMMLVK